MSERKRASVLKFPEFIWKKLIINSRHTSLYMNTRICFLMVRTVNLIFFKVFHPQQAVITKTGLSYATYLTVVPHRTKEIHTNITVALPPWDFPLGALVTNCVPQKSFQNIMEGRLMETSWHNKRQL